MISNCVLQQPFFGNSVSLSI